MPAGSWQDTYIESGQTKHSPASLSSELPSAGRAFVQSRYQRACVSVRVLHRVRELCGYRPLLAK